ncbi:MAG: Golgi transport complex subunit 3 [Cirrosporium novae-zelandiae]|nr:MAG: Golgi transport complex subunit 3 [Cirrosporium novae-zelandiae]
MYDDASFYTFVPAAQPQENQWVSRNRKRTSTIQKRESAAADTNQVEDDLSNIMVEESTNSPSKATIARRAKSYSDFYEAAKAQLGEDAVSESKPVPGSQIKTELEFMDWYSSLEDDLLSLSNDKYQNHLDQLNLQISHLDSILDGTSSTLDLLSSLSSSFRAVQAQTTAFQKQCEGLLTEQKRLTTLADGIGENLQYYGYLEPITRRLNAPSAGNFVRGQDFSEMLTHLDECLRYMKKHLNQKEAEIYRSRYNILLTRALTLIRTDFVGSLRDVANDVSKRIADRQLNDTTMSALLYAKFRTGAPDLKRLGIEIQKRAELPADAEPGSESEYQSLMNELYTAYSSTRARLVLPILRKRISEIALAPSSATDLVAFSRSSISYIQGICMDEYDLWNEWFEGQENLYDFLESICEPLYDHLRPRIIHEIQLLKLCELCTLLQTRYMDEEDEEEQANDDQLDFSSLIHPALEDAQTRLVFRTQAILRDEIEYYKPKPEDIDYPARIRKVPLSGKKDGSRVANGSGIQKTSTLVEREGDLADEKDFSFDFGTEAAFEGWYPTLRKAIWLLSRIYRLVNSTVFDDLAHRIVHQTTLSLHQASTQIATKSTLPDSQLFLIKHLLILKQQIVAFDIEYVTPDVSLDFSTITNTFWELRSRGGLFNPRNLVRLVGSGLIPRVVENMLDAKVELDGRLRTVINDYVASSASKTTTSVAVSMTEKRSFDAAAAVRTLRDSIVKEVPVLRAKLDEYLPDARTKETLVAAVQDQVMQNYEDFCEALEQRAAVGNDKKVVSKHGKGREDGVWDSDTFAEWMEGVFQVRMMPGMMEDGTEEEEDENNGDSSSTGSMTTGR